MKVAFFSDLHLGFSEDAFPQAKLAFEKALEIADVVVTCGDLFDFRVPKQETLHEGLTLFGEFSQKFFEKNKGRFQVRSATRSYPLQPMVTVFGTHERRSKGMVNPVHLMDEASVAAECHNRKIFIEDKNTGEVVCVQGLGGLPEEYAKPALDAVKFTPESGCFNVFIFHQTLKEVIPFKDVFISIPDLPNGFDLYVDGHIHWRRELKEHGRHVLLTGSTVITQQKKNEQEKKGLWLYDSVTKDCTFHYIESRPFFYRELEFKEALVAEVYSLIEKTLSEIPLEKKPLVKLKLTGTLARGISSSDVDLRVVFEKNQDAMKLSIDRDFEINLELKEKIEHLRKMREESKTVREIGLSVLRGKLETNNYKLGREEELFDALSEGDLEKAKEIIK